MYFPTAGIETSPAYPFLFALGVSLFCSPTGVSGAFLLLPYQVSLLGYTQPGVSATNQFFNILACPAGVWRYAREGRLLLPLAALIALGTLPGVFIGAIIRIKYLADPAAFKIFAALVLLYLGGRMLFGKNLNKRRASGSPPQSLKVTCFTWRGFSFNFEGGDYRVSSPSLVMLSLAVGLAGGIYGIGGGAILSPFLVSLYGLPVHAIAGAALFATFLTSVAGVAFYSCLSILWNAPSAGPDWGLGLCLGLGGILGMYCGASLQKYISARVLRIMLIIIILSLAVLYLGQSLGG